jgi:hypothetical protein
LAEAVSRALVAAGSTVIDRAPVAVCGLGVLASVTLAVKCEVATAVGVPEMIPELAARLRAAGSEPAVSFQVYIGAPPLAARFAVYGVPKVACGRLVELSARGDVVWPKAGVVKLCCSLATSDAAAVTPEVQVGELGLAVAVAPFSSQLTSLTKTPSNWIGNSRG